MKTNLIACKSCGGMIAKTSKKCPQCGASFQSAGTILLAATGWMMIIVGGFIAMNGVYVWQGGLLVAIGAGMNFGADALKRVARGG